MSIKAKPLRLSLLRPDPDDDAEAREPSPAPGAVVNGTATLPVRPMPPGPPAPSGPPVDQPPAALPARPSGSRQGPGYFPRNPPPDVSPPPARPAAPPRPSSGVGLLRNRDGSIRFMANGKVENFSANELQNARQILPKGGMGDQTPEAAQAAQNSYIRNTTAKDGEDTTDAAHAKDRLAWTAGAGHAKANGYEMAGAKVLPGGQYVMASLSPQQQKAKKEGILRQEAARQAAEAYAKTPEGQAAAAAKVARQESIDKKTAADVDTNSQFFRVGKYAPKMGGQPEGDFRPQLISKSDKNQRHREDRVDVAVGLMRGEAEKDRELERDRFKIAGEFGKKAALTEAQGKADEERAKRRTEAMKAFEDVLKRGIGETTDPEGKTPRLDKDGNQTYRPYDRPGERDNLRREKLQEYGAWEPEDERAFQVQGFQLLLAQEPDPAKRAKIGKAIQQLQAGA